MNWRQDPLYRGRATFRVPLAELGELEGVIDLYRFGARINWGDDHSQKVRSMMAAKDLPPIIIKKDWTGRWIIYNGHHRVAAAWERGDTDILAVEAQKGDSTMYGVIA